MSINSGNSCYTVNRGSTFTWITDYLFAKKGHSIAFFTFYNERHADRTRA